MALAGLLVVSDVFEDLSACPVQTELVLYVHLFLFVCCHCLTRLLSSWVVSKRLSEVATESAE